MLGTLLSMERKSMLNFNSYPYLKGVCDGYVTGVYDQQFHDKWRELTPNGGAEYKAGYDRGISIYCDENNLND